MKVVIMTNQSAHLLHYHSILFEGGRMETHPLTCTRLQQAQQDDVEFERQFGFLFYNSTASYGFFPQEIQPEICCPAHFLK